MSYYKLYHHHLTIQALAFIFCLFVLSVIPIHSQNINLKREPYTDFHNISLPLDMGMVYCTLQDSNGMIWFGMRGGLCSWNGYQTHTYRSEIDPNAHVVNCLLEADADKLYVGTDYGLLLFNIATRKFQQLPCTSQTVGARSIVRMGSTLYIGTAAAGLVRYDTKNQTTQTVGFHGEAMPQVKALAIIGKKLYVGYYYGLVSTSNNGRHWTRENIDKDIKINSIYYDNKTRNLFIATDDNGLMSYSIDTHKAARIGSGHIRQSKVVTADARGNILFGSEEGLYIYQPFGQTMLHAYHDSRYPSSLCNDMVTSITTDRAGNVIIGTDRGVSFYPQTEQMRMISLSSLTDDGHGNLITAMLRDSHGDYWIGGEHGLLHLTSSGVRHMFLTSSPTHPLRNNNIRGIFEDSKHRLWINTDDGIALYNRQHDRFDYVDFVYPQGNFGTRWSYSISEDKYGRLWIASYFDGLFVVSGNKIGSSVPTQVVTDTVLFGYQTYDIKRLNDNTMVANTQKGIAFIDTKSLHVTTTMAYDDNMAIHQGSVYYSSMGRLYQFYKPKQFCEIKYQSGQSYRIHSFASDNAQLWFSTSDGLYYIDARSQCVRRYTTVRQGFLSTYFDEKEQAILFGGHDCIAIVPVANIEINEKKHIQIHIASILSNGQELINGTDYKLYRRKKQSVEIELLSRIGLQIELYQSDYSDRDRTEFYYHIDDDGAWSKIEDGSNLLSLVALSGGKHTIRLCGENPTINPQAYIYTLILAVPYPWYATWQAITAYIIVALLIVIFIMRQIANRNKHRYEQRERERILELLSLKMDFFVNISHELKTPLSLIVAPIGRIMTEIKDKKAKEQLAIVEKNALRLNTLIRKILDFKRLEYESEETLMFTRVDLCSLLRGSMANFATSATQREIAMEFKSDVESLTMDVDALKIESIMANLLSNAMRHVADHTGQVFVTLSQNAETVEINVSDNGAGVSPRELSLLFERYFHGDAISTGSSGIGLHLVKKFAQLHGGTVAARNDNGLSITVTLPYKIKTTEVKTEQPTATTADNTTTLMNKNIVLIVDDNREILDFISQSLIADYDCMTACDGLEALDVIADRKPDIAIIDQMMPRMDGMTLARRLRANMSTATLPIIMLTAKDDNQTEMESLQTGIDVFISKPFSMHKLQLQIVRLLKSRQTIEACRRITEKADPTYEADTPSLSLDEALLERINEIINRDMSQQGFSVEALAEATNLSTKSLYRKIKQLTGVTPVKYIMRLRMKKAQALLAGHSFTVTEVCYMVGLSNPSYFSKCFSEEFGISPKDFAEKSSLK